MKIPKNIRIAMKDCQNYHQKAKVKDEKIRRWMYKNNILNDGTIDQYIDTCEQGQGDIEELVNSLEKNFDLYNEKGNTYEP